MGWVEMKKMPLRGIFFIVKHSSKSLNSVAYAKAVVKELSYMKS